MKQKHITSLSRQEREKVRLEAAKLFQKNVSQADIAGKFKATPSAVSQWHAAWEKSGAHALKSKGPTGFPSKLTPQKQKKFREAILKGPLAYGYETDFWTLSRLAAVMKRVAGVTFKHNHTWEIVREMGFTCQKPQARAAQRDEAAIRDWKQKRLPGLKKWAQTHGFSLGYEDESGISEKPVVRKTWSVKGKTPTIISSASWKSLTMAGLLIFTPKGNHPRMFFMLQPGGMDTYDFIDFLKDVKTEMRGGKLLLIWDGQPPFGR